MYHIGVNVLAYAGAITAEMEDEQIDEAIRTCVYPRVAENVYWEGYKHTPRNPCRRCISDGGFSFKPKS